MYGRRGELHFSAEDFRIDTLLECISHISAETALRQCLDLVGRQHITKLV